MKSVPALVSSASLFVLLFASFFTIQTAHPASISAATQNTSRQDSARVEKVHPFEFHSGFWINLHHFLYEQALQRKKERQAGQTAAANRNELSPEQNQLWNAAVDYYVKSMIKRDFVSDEGMIVINDQLAEAEAAFDLSKSGVTAELAKILESVAPTYRARWWPQHDKMNRFWISVVTPMIQQLGPKLISQLTTAYQTKWPTSAIRVDVVEYANWAGAYTTMGRQVHITVATDPAQQGFVALELLFHEASHSMVHPRDGAVARAIASESQKRNKPIPDGLWHAIIFYTAGEFTKRNLSEYGVIDYIPMGYRGLYERAWPKLQRPLELYWQPYLDGKVDFDTAITNMIDAL